MVIGLFVNTVAKPIPPPTITKIERLSSKDGKIIEIPIPITTDSIISLIHNTLQHIETNMQVGIKCGVKRIDAILHFIAKNSKSETLISKLPVH